MDLTFISELFFSYAYLLYNSVLAMRKALAKNLNTLKLGGWRTCFSVLTEHAGETQIPNHHCMYQNAI